MAQLDNIPAMLQSGEYVVRKEAVDKLGKDTMDMINNADRLGYMGGGLVPQGEHGHSAIDELLALNTLANQRSVDMTRGSAMMNKGGMAKKKMYGYENGGMTLRMAPYDTPNIDYVNLDYNLDPRRNRYGDKVYNPIIDRYQAADLAGQEVRDILYQLTTPRFGYKDETRKETPEDLQKVFLDVISRDREKMNERDASLLRKFDRLYDQTAEKDYRNRILAAQNLYGYDRGVRTKEMFEEPYLFENEKKEASDLVRKIKNTPAYRDALSEMRNEQRLNVLKRLVKEGKLPESVLVNDFIGESGKRNGYREGGLGVQDKLAMAMDEFKDIEKMLSYATPSEYLMPKSQRDMLDLLQESGQVDVEKALEALDLIQRRYQEGSVGFHMPRYQNGGIASYQDGGYSPSDSIQQYYETFGYEPTDEKTKKQFEKLYAYDPSEALGDVGELRTDISRQLGTATADTASYGRGFGAFGGRQRSMGDIRRRAEETYETGVTDIMETSREASEADALQFLAQLQQSDAGMRQFTVEPEDNPVSELPTTNQGPVFYNGSTWIWSEEEGQYVQS